MTVKEIHERMLRAIDDNFDKSDGGFIYDVTNAVAIVVDAQKTTSDDTLTKLDVDNLSAVELERFIYQHTGLERKYATFASDTALLTGTPSTVVGIGSLVAADSIFYATVEEVTLDENGQAYVLVESELSGSIGNVPVGAINSFPVTLSGVTSVINERALTNGYAAETDSILRQRYYDKLQRPGKAGNAYHYREWATEVVGVGKVKVYPLWDGPLTVKVVIVDANIAVPSAELLTDVDDYITMQRPFGAILTVSPANALTINVSVDITLRNNRTHEDVRESLEGKINAYLKSLAFESNYVSRAQIGRIILETDGIEDYTDLKINNGTSNIDIPDATIPVLGEVTLL